MKDFIVYILTELRARVPEAMTVRVFNNQFERSNQDDPEDNDEAAFDYPAIFVEVEAEETKPVGMGITYYNLLVRLHIGTEGYDLERLGHYDLVDIVHNQMRGMRGSDTDTVQFSQFIDTGMQPDDNFNNVKVTVKEYRTTYTDKSAYKRAANVEKTTPNTVTVITS